MTDRELLEMAAKAAGCEIERHSEKYGVLVSVRDGVIVWWDPLTNDGDALRLAVTLGLFVCQLPSIGKVGIRTPSDHMAGQFDEVEDYGSDPYAATRRAIVRAAAEIGKQIEGGQHGTE